MLAETLRNASRPQHQSAENSSFITRLMGGELNLDAYSKYLTNLAWLYQALEAKVRDGMAFPSSEQLWDSRLERLESITADLEALGVSDWRTTTSPSAAMKSYIEHIVTIEGKNDFRLVAHHYTRYLGDLSGGQAIAALVARHYGAKPEQLSFYSFDEIEDIVRFKEDYREKLNSLALSSDQIDLLVKEVQLSFELNQKVFEDLAV